MASFATLAGISEKVAQTILTMLDAVDGKGNPDHKTRVLGVELWEKLMSTIHGMSQSHARRALEEWARRTGGAAPAKTNGAKRSSLWDQQAIARELGQAE